MRKEKIGFRGCGGDTGAPREERRDVGVVAGRHFGRSVVECDGTREGEEDGSQEGGGEERWVGEPKGIVKGVDVRQEVWTRAAVGW
jgi:hypothetical protein